MSIGRNDLCPCGSGKKYKRCCINTAVTETYPEKVQPVILIKETGDYGVPKAGEEFFAKNPLPEEGFSAHRLLYSCLLRPELEFLAGNIAKSFFFRGEAEKDKIIQINDAAGLIAILKQSPDPLNHRLLADKLLDLREITVPILIDELRQVQNDCFVEQAIRIIYRSGIDCSSILLKLIATSAIDAYALSLICMLCGMTGSQEALKPLWDRFHFFKEKYPNENFYQGPWLGLYELTYHSTRKEIA
jgi:hypothetical protein